MRSIVIGTSDVKQAPKLLKLLVNRPAVGFEDVENADEPEVAQVLEVSEQDATEGKPVALRFVRFQAVNCLHVCSPFELKVDRQ